MQTLMGMQAQFMRARQNIVSAMPMRAQNMDWQGSGTSPPTIITSVTPVPLGVFDVYTFTPGSYNFIVKNNVALADYLVVGGGGACPSNLPGTGGGAGGVITGRATLRPGTYALTVGAGGSSSGAGANGGNTSFTLLSGQTLVAIGGGAGSNGLGFSGVAGASGGGGWGDGNGSTGGGAGIPGQGFPGGNGVSFGSTGAAYGGGGGGGAGGPARPGGTSLTSTGGPGLISSITGSAIEYAQGAGSINGIGASPTSYGSGGFNPPDGVSGVIILKIRARYV